MGPHVETNSKLRMAMLNNIVSMLPTVLRMIATCPPLAHDIISHLGHGTYVGIILASWMNRHQSPKDYYYVIANELLIHDYSDLCEIGDTIKTYGIEEIWVCFTAVLYVAKVSEDLYMTKSRLIGCCPSCKKTTPGQVLKEMKHAVHDITIPHMSNITCSCGASIDAPKMYISPKMRISTDRVSNVYWEITLPTVVALGFPYALDPAITTIVQQHYTIASKIEENEFINCVEKPTRCMKPDEEDFEHIVQVLRINGSGMPLHLRDANITYEIRENGERSRKNIPLNNLIYEGSTIFSLYYLPNA